MDTDFMTMTLDEQKLAVCGKLGNLVIIDYWWSSPLVRANFPVLRWTNGSKLINWPTEGLQVCHEAEKLIYGTSTWDAYYRWLICLLDKNLDSDLGEDSQNYIHATFEQRLEAMCRVWWPEKFQS